MWKALITGGAGFIGSHLAEVLFEHGDQVQLIDNLSTGSMQNIAHLQIHTRFSHKKGPRIGYTLPSPSLTPLRRTLPCGEMTLSKPPS
jgi:nucleoside-diphosphate-sugar epimerase